MTVVSYSYILTVIHHLSADSCSRLFNFLFYLFYFIVGSSRYLIVGYKVCMMFSMFFLRYTVIMYFVRFIA